LAVLAASHGVYPISSAHAAQQVANWNVTAGNWNTAGDWDIGTVPNNGTPTGTTYAVNIATPGTGKYNVLLTSSTPGAGTIAVDSVTINSSNANLDVTANGSLTLQDLTVSAGSFQLGNATASLNAADAGATYSIGSAGTFDLANGTINGGLITGSGSIEVLRATLNNVTIDTGTTVNIVSSGPLTLGGNWASNGAITGTNASLVLGGSFDLASANSLELTSSTASLTGTLTMGAADVLNLGGALGTWTLNGGTITNGTVNSTAPITVNSGTLDNLTIGSGASVSIANGGTLSLLDNWVNNGTISGNQATLNLGGNFSLPALSSINLTNSAVNLLGNLTLGSSDVLPVNAAGNTWTLGGGSISGGTVAESTTEVLHAQNGTLQNVQISGGDLVDDSTVGNLYLQNVTVNDGKIDLNGSDPRVYYDGASQTVDNVTINCTPILTAPYAPIAAFIVAGGPQSTGPVTLTLGSHAILEGLAFINDNPSIAGDTLINNGTIDANINNAGEGYQLNIDTSNFTNNGTIEATNSGSLSVESPNWSGGSDSVISVDNAIASLDGTWSTAGSITAKDGSLLYLEGNFTGSSLNSTTVSADSTVTILGNMNNTGNALTLNGGTWNLGAPRSNGGTITGGSIGFSNGAALQIVDGTLDGVQIAGADIGSGANVSSDLTIQNGLTGDGHKLDFSGATSGIFVSFSGTQTIDGFTVDCPAGGSTGNEFETTGMNDPTVTLGSKMNFASGYFQFDETAPSTLVNNGTISSNHSLVAISDTNFINNGVLQAINGGLLYVGGSTWTNNSTVTALGASTLKLFGTFSNTGSNPFNISSDSTVDSLATLNNANQTLAISSGTWNISGGINGGIVALQNGENPDFQGPLTLQAVQFADGNASLYGLADPVIVQNGLSSDGHSINMLGAFIFNGSQTLDNATFTGGVHNGSEAELYIEGSGNPTLTIGSNATLNIDGFVESSNVITGGSPLPTTLTNNGTILENANQGIDIASSTFVNNGTVKIAGGFLTLDSATIENNGSITMRGGQLFKDGPNPTITLGGTLNLSGTADCNLVLDSDPANLTFNIGGTAQSSQYDYLNVQGTAQLGGNLLLTFAGGFQSQITSADQFEILSATSIEGSFLNVASGSRLVTTDGYGSFLVSYGASSMAGDEIVLSDFQPLPEPAFCALALGGSVFLLKRNRDRKIA
jgi:hypothetical protein